MAITSYRNFASGKLRFFAKKFEVADLVNLDPRQLILVGIGVAIDNQHIGSAGV
jgi:hypothetical protein